MKDELSGSEAVFGFVGWLTTSKEFKYALANPGYGPSQDSAPWAELAKRFCNTNKLENPREGWSDLLTHPEERKSG